MAGHENKDLGLKQLKNTLGDDVTAQTSDEAQSLPNGRFSGQFIFKCQRQKIKLVVKLHNLMLTVMKMIFF